MAVTYEPITTTTLSSNQSSVTFSSISGNYTDLILICHSLASTANDALTIRFNSDSGSNYSYTQFGGTGTATFSNSESNKTYARFANNIQTTQGSLTKAEILNYSNNTTFKNILSRSGDARDGGTVGFINLWRNTSAITSIVVGPEGGANIAAGSTFTLYGILKA